MSNIIISLLLFVIGGFASLLITNRKLSSLTGLLSAVVASIIPLSSVIKVLLKNTVEQRIYYWNMPEASIVLQVDSLSALFLLPLLILSAAVAIFGYEYLISDKKHPGFVWFSFNILVASMISVLLAKNGIFFLFAWEIMSLSSLLLVVHDHEKAEVQRAGWIYFAATHTGTAFLFPMFFLLAKFNGSFNLLTLNPHSITGTAATVIFFLSLVGFGCKAGLVPFHIWLPEAHPAAPSHVSALMSGIMIKMGIYGILRVISYLGAPELSWGIVLLVLGVISGLTGILFALSQKDIKRLLAYSSVENIGIITIGIGIGLIGINFKLPFLVVCGFAGALLHIVNHAFFKGVLFLSAGAVYHSTGTRNMEVLGGLIRKIPFVAYVVLIGSIAICGLPPLNGFISEFFIYFASLKAIIHPSQITDCAGILVIFALACIGGLAVICFTRFFCIVFIGEMRDTKIHVHKTGPLMKVAFSILLIMCIIVAFGFSAFTGVLNGPIHILAGSDMAVTANILNEMGKDFSSIVSIFLLLITVFLISFVIIKVLLHKRVVKSTGTWDCGYAAPSARMQYTGTSYVQPLVDYMSKIFFPRNNKKTDDSYFPVEGSFKSDVKDNFMDFIFRPMYKAIIHSFSHLRWLQGGKVHVYVMYIATAIVVTLVITFIK